MPPLISVVGRSNVGKTTLLERLIPELRRRGYRVASVKHDVHGFDIDRPGKDSWRHAQAGSQAVVIASPQKLALIKELAAEPSLEEIARLLGDEYDIILTEGYKTGPLPKIEVHRREFGPLLCSPNEVMAVATDEPLDYPAPQFGLEDAAGLVDLIEERFLRSRGVRGRVSLMVDGKPVYIGPFVEEVVIRTVGGLLSALKGVEDPKNADLSLRWKERA